MTIRARLLRVMTYLYGHSRKRRMNSTFSCQVMGLEPRILLTAPYLLVEGQLSSVFHGFFPDESYQLVNIGGGEAYVGPGETREVNFSFTREAESYTASGTGNILLQVFDNQVKLRSSLSFSSSGDEWTPDISLTNLDEIRIWIQGEGTTPFLATSELVATTTQSDGDYQISSSIRKQSLGGPTPIANYTEYEGSQHGDSHQTASGTYESFPVAFDIGGTNYVPSGIEFRNWHIGRPKRTGDHESRADIQIMSELTVTITPPQDLMVDSISVEGDVRRLDFGHHGTGSYEVAFVQSADDTFNAESDLIVSRTTVSGSGFSSIRFPEDWMPRPELPFFLIVADPGNTVTEIYESNNVGAVLPGDFSVSSIHPILKKVKKATVLDKIEIEARYRRQIGGADGSEEYDWDVHAYWATGDGEDDIIDPENPAWKTSVDVSQMTLSRISIPAAELDERPANATHLIVVADPQDDDKPFGKNLESNELNNVIASPVRFNLELVTAEYERLFKPPKPLTNLQTHGLLTLINYLENDAQLEPITSAVGLRQAAYMLATAKHETKHTFWPVYEDWDLKPHKLNSKAKYKAKSEQDYFNYWYSDRNGNGNYASGDGYTFRGRGYVQLTGRTNYFAAGPMVGFPTPSAPFIGNPDLALDPDLSYLIMSRGMLTGLFTYKKLGTYINSSRTDYRGARAVVNGTDADKLIAGYAEKFEQILTAALGPGHTPED